METNATMKAPLEFPRFPNAGDAFPAIESLRPVLTAPGGPGARLRLVREVAPAFRAEFAATGTPDLVETCDLVTVPYPTRFGLWRAATATTPYLLFANRVLVVRWPDSTGRTRTLLFNPSDVSLGAQTPYLSSMYAEMSAETQEALVTVQGTVKRHLKRLGIAPEDVDYIAYDHLHTQDVRRWLGTTGPQPDISPDGPVSAFLPRAKLIVQRPELDAMTDLHPLQIPWYQAESLTDVPADSVMAIDGDVLLGPGVALIHTPGHSAGNQSLALNTSTGIWTCSENAIAAECLTPEHSQIPGVAQWAKASGQEVVINANTLERTAEQFNSVVLEKCVADPSTKDPRFPQFFPSSELTPHPLCPGTAPTFMHRAISHRN